jgi:hypothetical protein
MITSRYAGLVHPLALSRVFAGTVHRLLRFATPCPLYAPPPWPAAVLQAERLSSGDFVLPACQAFVHQECQHGIGKRFA